MTPGLPTSFAGMVVAVVLGAWFTASALVQIPVSAIQRLRRWDPLGLLPHWSFFAPQPATGDFHLLYRDQLRDGTVTEWSEVRNLCPRRWWHMVWNPGRRQNKALFDLTTALGSEALRHGPSALSISVNYLTLLNFVSHLPRSEASEYVQFMLMLSHGADSAEEPSMILLSNLHRL